jgi:hypothetical protein
MPTPAPHFSTIKYLVSKPLTAKQKGGTNVKSQPRIHVSGRHLAVGGAQCRVFDTYISVRLALQSLKLCASHLTRKDTFVSRNQGIRGLLSDCLYKFLGDQAGISKRFDIRLFNLQSHVMSVCISQTGEYIRVGPAIFPPYSRLPPSRRSPNGRACVQRRQRAMGRRAFGTPIVWLLQLNRF